jgi:predicted metal-dependent phosphoesterase TrpH
MEISSAGGHILAYGITEEIPRDLEPAETRDRIHAQGGMAVVPHPYRFWSGLGEEATLRIKPDAVEAFNAHSTARENRLAGKLAQRMELPATAGSDSHELPSLGRAYTLVPDASSEEEVLDAIKAGRTQVGGRSRKTGSALKDRTISVFNWVGRGFKKM